MTSKTRGFTLIELLIASTLLLVVALSIFSALQIGIFGYGNIDEALNGFLAGGQIIERINSDLRNSFLFSKGKPLFSGTGSEINFLTILDTYEGNNRQKDVAFISYTLVNNKLLRLCRKNKESLNEKSNIQPDEMTGDIEKISFSYGQAPDPKEPLQWQSSWIAQEKLPAAVKVLVSIKKKSTITLVRTIYIPQGG
ncbi:MAG: type II secretion system protein GspJ [Candidatus Omnitrophota bacterium]|jgi:prepilin-type N-terminal cleavage/methylation domain-containing protein